MRIYLIILIIQLKSTIKESNSYNRIKNNNSFVVVKNNNLNSKKLDIYKIKSLINKRISDKRIEYLIK